MRICDALRLKAKAPFGGDDGSAVGKSTPGPRTSWYEMPAQPVSSAPKQMRTTEVGKGRHMERKALLGDALYLIVFSPKTSKMQ